MNIIIDYPWYFAVFCVLLGMLYTALLYYRNRKTGLPKKIRIVLGVIRFSAITLLAFLLLAPLAKQTFKQKEKPIIIVAQDNSSSLLYSKDSAYYRTEYRERMGELVERLEKDYDVQTYLFGSGVREGSDMDFTDQKTDMGAFLSDLQTRYENRNVGGVLLAGDGIYTIGSNPVSAAEALPYPVYTVAMGDTSIRRDAVIHHVKYNRLAYLGNQFPVEITVKGNHLKGLTKKLTVSKDGKTLFSKDITYTDNDFSVTEPILLEADKTGLQYYTIALEPADHETSKKNNSRTMVVDVIDGHQKVAIVAHAPHPDIAALKRSIEENQNYRVDVYLAKDFQKAPASYNLIILHQLPSDNLSSLDKVHEMMKARVPVLFVIGEQTNISRFNGLKTGLEIFSKIEKTNESQPSFETGFTAFSFPEAAYRKIEQFPPLLSPFGEYKPATNAQYLFTAKIGNISSNNPLVAFVQMQEVRYGFFVGEGLWKWALSDFLQNHTQENFNMLIHKTVMYLSLRIQKERFLVTTQHMYPETEPIVFEGELYNENYELVNAPDVVLTVTTPENEKKAYPMNRTHNSYHLNIGSLPAGKYTYSANTVYNNKPFVSSGSFVVEDLMLEDIRLVADHTLLNTLAQKTGGRMLYPKDLLDFPEMLKQRDDVKTVIYHREKYSELMNLPFIFILLVFLLGLEWVLRKYNGEL